MIWLSRPTKRLLLEMSVGVILWNVILAVLAVLFLPGFSYPVVPVILGLIVGAAGAMMMLVHMAVITERALDSQSENYASKLTVAQNLLRKVMFVAALFFFWRVLKIDLLSGVIIMGLWYGMMPIFANIGIPAALHVYCDLFSGCIQTYVFCMLTMVYINDKME